jgi:hypothetical protein
MDQERWAIDDRHGPIMYAKLLDQKTLNLFILPFYAKEIEKTYIKYKFYRESNIVI